MANIKIKKERSILDSIYKSIPGLEIIKNEKPDFRLIYKNEKFYFGVEVTEFYFSGSSARMRNITDYVGDLLNEKKYRHKNDKKELEIEKVTIVSKNGHEKGEVEGILYKLPGLSYYLKKINQIIRDKNKAFNEYDKTLNHINLIINDTEIYLFPIKLKDFYNTFFTKDIIKSIIESDYREIYFITTVEKDKRLYLPLKMILFLSRIYAFSYFLTHHYQTDSALNEEESYNFFMEYLNYQGFSEVKNRRFNQNIEIIYGNVGFYMKNSSKIILKDYQDFELPPDAETIDIKKYHYITKDVERNFDKFHNHISFETEVGFKVKK